MFHQYIYGIKSFLRLVMRVASFQSERVMFLTKSVVVNPSATTKKRISSNDRDTCWFDYYVCAYCSDWNGGYCYLRNTLGTDSNSRRI